MIRTITSLLLAAVLAAASHAATPVPQQPLPPVNIDDLGECVGAEGDTSFVPWSSDSLAGKVQVVEHTAARAGVEKLNSAFYSALAAAGLPGDKFGITKIVNSDDAMWGTSSLVAGEVAKNKLATPDIAFVVDAEGTARQRWDLEEKTAALIILDNAGQVVYFKQGGTSAEDAATALKLLESLVIAE
ncbi:YtfJ family protein [Haliea sp. E17]|uniref:YtfJ family protein n=1 Tax=Haliea sp. E17 TaxID=3401576 RepID=UPI003AAD9FD3